VAGITGFVDRLPWTAFVCGTALLACAAPAAAEPSLTSLRATASWSGSISNTAVPAPSACTQLTCQSSGLRLRLPRRSLRSPAGMLVSLRWPDEQLDALYDLDLYVYGPDGSLVAKSNMVTYSSAEGAWVQNPANGRYRVVVAGRDVAGTSPYRIHVDLKRGYTVHTKQSSQVADPTDADALPYTPDFVFLGSRPRRPRRLLPDLVPDRPKNFHIESAVGTTFYQSFDRGLRHQPSCYLQETTGADADHPGDQKPGALRCLRFDQGLINRGSGPFEIRAFPDQGNGTDAYQVVYRTDGSYAERKAGSAEFSNAHGHVHYRGFENTGLYTINPDGTAGRLVKKMVDKGRCAVDTTNWDFGRRSNGPPHYYVPSTCDTNDNEDPDDHFYPDADYFRSAISPGWEDLYPWFILDSYLDITDVPDGRYLVIDRINEARIVQERTRRNDVSKACVEFHGTTVSECAVVTR
jgi:hypothetical protein